MNATFLKNHVTAFVVVSTMLSIGWLSVSTAQAQGRRGGGGGSGSSSSSSGRSSGGSNRSSGNARRSSTGNSGVNRSSASSSSSSSSTGRNTTRSAGRGSGRSADQRSSGGGSQVGSVGDSTRVEGRNRDRSIDNNLRVISTGERERNRTSDRDRSNDRDRDGDADGNRGRHHRHPGRDRDRDRADWHRRECSRGRFLYPTRVYLSSNYGNYHYSSNSYEQGYQDGLYTGANDALRGESYDPGRSHFYKHGAGGFLSIFGGLDTYRLAYRDGFLRGYEEGYEHYEMYFTGRRFHR